MARKSKKGAPNKTASTGLSPELNQKYQRAKAVFRAGDYASATKLYEDLLKEEGSESIHDAVRMRLAGFKVHRGNFIYGFMGLGFYLAAWLLSLS